MTLFFLPVLFFSLISYYANIETRVMNTSVHWACPFLKLHHLVLFSNPSVERSVYIVDFSPVNQTDTSTLKNLVMGKNVPGELRIRYLKNATIHDDEKILDIIDSREKYVATKDKRIQKIIEKIQTWNETDMNMYTRNCQHFSKFAIKKMRSLGSLSPFR